MMMKRIACILVLLGCVESVKLQKQEEVAPDTSRRETQTMSMMDAQNVKQVVDVFGDSFTTGRYGFDYFCHGADVRDEKKPTAKSAEQYFVCLCPMQMMRYVTTTGKNVSDVVKGCADGNMAEPWHTDNAETGDLGAVSILQKKDWNKLNTNLLKVFGEGVPRTLLLIWQTKALLSVARKHYVGEHAEADNFLFKVLTPISSCATGDISYCFVAVNAMEQLLGDNFEGKLSSWQDNAMLKGLNSNYEVKMS